MNPDGILFHVGINFVIAPIPAISQRNFHSFQLAILDEGVDLGGIQSQYTDQAFIIGRAQPSPLEIRVINVPGAPIGQFLVSSAEPKQPLVAFNEELDAITKAFDKVWPAQNRQFLSRDVTIRYLFESGSEHAFQELWETRLHQSPTSLAVLGRPVFGGGLRFVMPPLPGEAQPCQIEVKIESLLKDSKKIFVESQFVWPQPVLANNRFDGGTLINTVDAYIENHVIAFIMEANHDSDE